MSYEGISTKVFRRSIAFAIYMFARFDKNPAMTLQDIKKTKCYGWTHAHTDARTHGHTHARTDMKTVYPPQSLRGV